ncbi:GtrA family protein [Halomarina litorea]|uniref:GtrA family protein n=1 Tax=Halomarina litorea TaxID=2961595 RepID=UPI0020C28576|nr:GtrA family protein [Halomarina sp. BCD28]
MSVHESTSTPRSRESYARFVRYLLVGLVGVGVNQSVLFLATGVAGISYVIGGALSRLVSIAVNYQLNDSWTWRDRGEPGRRAWTVRGGKYLLTRAVGVLVGYGSFVALVELAGLHYLLANLLAIAVGVLWGFGASERWVWRADESRSSAHSPEGSTGGPNGRGSDPAAASRRGIVTRAGGWLDAVVGRGRRIDRSTWSVLALSGLLFVGFSAYTVVLYREFQLTGADFGSYVHMFSTTLNGDGFLLQGKFRPDHPGGEYWGAHFSLTLLVFLPVFALAPYPETLLLSKAAVLAASVPVLWSLARHHVSDRVAGLVVVSYALNPFLWSAWAFDFQEQILLPLFVFVAFHAYARRRYVAFLVALGLAMLTNEFVVLVAGAALVGLLVGTLRTGEHRDGLPFIVAGAALAVVLYVVTGAVIAQFSVASGIPKRVLAVPLQPLVPGMRVSAVDLVSAALGDPDVVVRTVGANWQRKAVFFIAFLLPVGFLALYDEVSLGALAPFLLFAWFLSSKPAYYQFGAHYPLYLLPFLYVGALRVLARGRPGPVPWPTGRLSRHGVVALALGLLLVNAGAFAVIAGGNTQYPRTIDDDHEATLRAAIDAVPPDASLVVQNDVYPHVATRSDASFVVAPFEFREYERLYGPISPDYVLVDTALGRDHWPVTVVEVFGDRLGSEYGLSRYEDGVWLFERGYVGPVLGVTSDAPAFRFAATDLRTGTSQVVGDRLVATVSGPDAGNGQLWYGPYVRLLPGTYEARYRLHVTGSGEEPVVALNVAVGRDHRVIEREVVGDTDGWTDVAVRFTLDSLTGRVEFRGAAAGGEGVVHLERVDIRYVGRPSNASTEGARAGFEGR